MGEREFESWKAYYRLWPFDDYHRFHRPAIAGAMAGTLAERLQWLGGDQPETSGGDAGMNAVDRSVIAALGG